MPVEGDPLERRRERGLDESLAGAQRFATMEEDRPRVGGRLELGPRRGDGPREERADHEAVARESDGGGHHLGAGELAEAAVRLEQSGDHARGGRGAAGSARRGRPRVGDRPGGVSAGARIEREVLRLAATRIIEGERTAAAQSGLRDVGDRERECGRDRGVGGIATGPEDLGARRRGVGVRSGHHAAVAFDPLAERGGEIRRVRGRGRARDEQQRRCARHPDRSGGRRAARHYSQLQLLGAYQSATRAFSSASRLVSHAASSARVSARLHSDRAVAAECPRGATSATCHS